MGQMAGLTEIINSVRLLLIGYGFSVHNEKTNHTKNHNETTTYYLTRMPRHDDHGLASSGGSCGMEL